MTEDYPSVRAQAVCPLCQGEKACGLLVCWPCYRQHELRYGNPKVEAVIAQNESKQQSARLRSCEHLQKEPTQPL